MGYNEAKDILTSYRWRVPDFTIDGELESPASLKRCVEIAAQFLPLL